MVKLLCIFHQYIKNMITRYLLRSGASYFRNWIPHEFCVFGSTVEDAEWNSIGNPLHLMDHSLEKVRLYDSV